MATDPLLGAIVDRRYRVVDRLGTGGMGSVYLAEHLTLGRKFAIKVLRHEFNEQPEFLARFLRESRAATSIDHPNVIEVIDTGTLPDGRAYYVMEHLQGEDLQRTMRREGPLAWPRVRHIALQICDGLGLAHARGLVHRDLKPANCFRIRRGGDDDFIKLLDFGIVKLLGEQTATLTVDGSLLGTTHYMAPEQAMGRPVDHRADIYALGVMLYQLLSGQHPFPGRKGVEMLYAILHDAPVPLRDAAGDTELPAELIAVVAAAMHRDLALRTPSMSALAAALRAVEADPPTLRRTTRPPVPEPAVTPLEPPTADFHAHAGGAVFSREPTGVADIAAPEPSFDSKVTADRPPATSLTPASAPTTTVADPVAPWADPPLPDLPGHPTVVAPVLSVSVDLRAAPGRGPWRRWLAAAVLVGTAGAYVLAPGSDPSPDQAAVMATAAPAPAPAPAPAVASVDAPVRAVIAPAPAPVDLPLTSAPVEMPDPAAASPPAPDLPDDAGDHLAPAPVTSSPPATPIRTADSSRARVDGLVNAIKQKIQKRCFARLTVETVSVDVWIEAKTGALRQLQVAPPHDRTTTRICVEQVFKGTTFPPFTGRDYHKTVTTQIRPRA